MNVDALGNPLRTLLTAGQSHEAPHAKALLRGFKTQFVFADKAYDAEPILLSVTGMGAEAVIPAKSNRKEQRAYDKELYKERHLVECFIGKLKHFRRCFSRFDKLAELGPAGRALPVLAQLPQLLTLRLYAHLVAVKSQHNLARFDFPGTYVKLASAPSAQRGGDPRIWSDRKKQP